MLVVGVQACNINVVLLVMYICMPALIVTIVFVYAQGYLLLCCLCGVVDIVLHMCTNVFMVTCANIIYSYR